MDNQAFQLVLQLHVHVHYTVKPVLSGHLKRRIKIVFLRPLLLNAGPKHCRMLHLQYF